MFVNFLFAIRLYKSEVEKYIPKKQLTVNKALDVS